MTVCKRCGSTQTNLGKDGRGDKHPELCDACYWRKRAKKLKAKLRALEIEIEESAQSELSQDITDAYTEIRNRMHW